MKEVKIEMAKKKGAKKPTKRPPKPSAPPEYQSP